MNTLKSFIRDLTELFSRWEDVLDFAVALIGIPIVVATLPIWIIPYYLYKKSKKIR